jgi:hypothetical protein
MVQNPDQGDFIQMIRVGRSPCPRQLDRGHPQLREELSPPPSTATLRAPSTQLDLATPSKDAIVPDLCQEPRYPARSMVYPV